MKAPWERTVKEIIVGVGMLIDTVALAAYLFWYFILEKGRIEPLLALVGIWILGVIIIMTETYELK